MSVQADSGLTLELRSRSTSTTSSSRAIKRIVQPMMGFKSFACARILIAGIETMHLIRKGQLEHTQGRVSSAANQFYFLAF